MFVLPSGDLHIMAVRVSDAGRYTCIAENDYGSVDAEASLVLPGVGESTEHTVLFIPLYVALEWSSYSRANTLKDAALE